MDRYLVISVDTNIPWPVKDTEVVYRGQKILMRPETDTLAPTIVYKCDDSVPECDSLSFISCFLSALSWIERRKAREDIITGGGFPIKVGKSNTRCVSNDFKADFLPEPEDDKAMLVLALYREALNVNSVPFKFLSFYKIINVRFNSRHEQIKWINDNLIKLSEPASLERIEELNREQQDIGEYLYVSGRCAVAHGYSDPIVNPDKSTDNRRLSYDMPLMTELAELLIRTEYGIQTLSDIYQYHTYELDGIRHILGNEIVSKLKNNVPISISELPVIPNISIRLRDCEQYPSFENLKVDVVDITDGKLNLFCHNATQSVTVVLILDFSNEHLLYDPFESFHIRDEQTIESLNNQYAHITFLIQLFHNGTFELWGSDENKLLGRCNPYLPMNIDSKDTFNNFERIRKNISDKIEELNDEN